MAGYTLDAGALIAIERRERSLEIRLQGALDQDETIVIPAGVLAQVWRGGHRQARLAGFLAIEGVEIEPLDEETARSAGVICGVRSTSDVVDASVVVCARTHGHRVITSDPDDLARLDPQLELIVV